jgi:hypothetical protein
MKKIYLTALLGMMSHLGMSQSFFIPTTYRGAFAPSPEAQWTDLWTNWDPQNTVYPSATVTVTTTITTNTTWTANNTYLLQGQIYVTNGATLTIQPGTVILGDKNTAGSGLFITQGAKLNAAGTDSNPIVFTSNQPVNQRAIGDWGGIILMGKASNNNASGIANIEGIAPTALTQYGGGANPDDNDNSGILKYVRIEFGGYVYQPNKEINGLTFGAVGRGTTIDFVQVSFSNDDAYEWFGGTVNCRHLVSYRNLDDDFDTDNGFAGNVQFAVALRDPNIADNPSVSTSEGFESDNDAAGDNAVPQTRAIFSNVTIVGPLRGNTSATVAAGFKRGARIRRNSALKIFNSLFLDELTGVHIDGTACETNATNGSPLNAISASNGTTNPTYGVVKYKNNLVAGFIPGNLTQVNTGSTFAINNWFFANSNDSLASSSNILINPYGANFLNPDLRPAANSIALTNYSFVDTTLNTQLLSAPIAQTNLNYCVGAQANQLTATANSDCTLNWYTTATGGTSIATPTPSTASAGTFNYYVSQQNADGYEGPRTLVTVVINALPATPIITANGPTSFCTGGSVELTSNATSGNIWSNLATSNSITVTSSASYSVTVTDANGCSSTSNAVNVSVSNSPVPTINSTATSACQGETITLTSSPADTYLWSNGATTQTIDVITDGTFTVETTNTNACNGVGLSAPITLTFGTVPTATASFTTSGNVVTFSNSSSNATSYSWDFGDQTNSSAQNPVHAFAGNGSYNVVLTATNGNCSDTTHLTVVLSVGLQELETIGQVVLYPNPAQNEVNVGVYLNELAEVSITIYDITGKLVSQGYSGFLNSGENMVKLNTSELSSGLYSTVITTGKSIKNLRLILTK